MENGMLVIGVGEPKEEKGVTIKLPLASLSVDGVEPSEGDGVDISISGQITGISGDEATVELMEIDGQPVAESEGSEDNGEEDESEESLRKRAREYDYEMEEKN
jgi:hypothetical protein